MPFPANADVAELVDARDLKSLDGNVVRVRVPPPAPAFGRARAKAVVPKPQRRRWTCGHELQLGRRQPTISRRAELSSSIKRRTLRPDPCARPSTHASFARLAAAR